MIFKKDGKIYIACNPFQVHWDWITIYLPHYWSAWCGMRLCSFV